MVLEPSEIERGLDHSSPSSAPGPDMTPNSVGKRINRVVPSHILNLLTPVMSHGFHPPSVKKADGIVLDQPGRPSYDLPSSFCVIVLLQTFSKILERINNGHLCCVARVTGLVKPYLCGSLAGLSVADTCNTRTHEIRTLQMDKWKVCTRFQDIKEGFDHVNPSSLCSMRSAKRVNPYLVSWTRFFLPRRSCLLLFYGSPKAFTPVMVGPQSHPSHLSSMSHAFTSRSPMASPSPTWMASAYRPHRIPIPITSGCYNGSTLFFKPNAPAWD